MNTTDQKAITDESLQKIRNDIIANAEKLGMPRSGPCKTMHGEMFRALVKIFYRYFNSSDSMFIGCGAQSLGSTAVFLKNEFPTMKAIILPGLDELLQSSDNRYRQLLFNLATTALEIKDTQQDSPLKKDMLHYEQEWETSSCDECNIWHLIDNLESDGMGRHYCTDCC